MRMEIEEITYSSKPNVHMFGVYIKDPVYHINTHEAIIDFLKLKSMMYGKDNVYHVWAFSDKTVIPTSFDIINWNIPESRNKCFFHATQTPNGDVHSDNGKVYEFD